MEYFKVFLAISTLVVLSFGLDQPQMESGNSNINRTIPEGMNVTIYCNFSNYLQDDVFWVKNDTSYHSDGDVLEFENTTRYDMGLYLCQVFDNSTQENVTLETVYLDIWYKSEITSFNITPNMVTENDTITFYFEIESNPPGLWYLKNVNSDTTFTYAQGVGRLSYGPMVANCSDMGNFELMAFNGMGTMDSMTQNLTVLCAPRPSMVEYIQHSDINTTTMLLMNEIGYPYPTYNWTRMDGRPVPHSNQIDVDQVSLLNISIRSIEDFTYYMCTMTNEIGSYKAIFEIKPMGSPEPPYDLNISNITYSTVVISWTSGYDMGSSQSFYIMQIIPNGGYIQVSDEIPGTSFNHGVGQTWSHRQENLDSDSNITLSVVAVNNYGLYSKRASSGMTFRTLPAPPSAKFDHHSDDWVPVLGYCVAGVGALIGIICLTVFIRKRNRMSKAYEVL